MLLDTHAAIWLARGVDLSDESRHSITQARNGKGVYLSAVSVWEVGNLVRRQRAYLDMTLAGWVQGFLAAGGFHTVDLTVAVVIGAADLPGRFHDDPADRFLVATARHLDVPILTRDGRILAYAEAGHVAAIAC